jgi:hypothetical protein
MLQDPAQPVTVHAAPWQDMAQLPVDVQSMLHFDPVSQCVSQPPPPWQATLQLVLGAQAVVQPPLGQIVAQACEGDPHAKSQAPGWIVDEP